MFYIRVIVRVPSVIAQLSGSAYGLDLQYKIIIRESTASNPVVWILDFIGLQFKFKAIQGRGLVIS